MPLNLRKEDIQLLWLIQPNLQNQELEIKKKFDKPIVSMEVNDLMYVTISSDFDYIYKLNPASSSYRGNSTFFVFKVNASSQSIQDYLVLKLNEEIDSSTLDSFMSYLMDYTDLLDLESSSLKNEVLRKIFLQFKHKETCVFNKNEDANKQDVFNSLNSHHQVYVDKEKADMIKNGGEVLGNGIVSLATMASNLIDTIGTQIATNCEQQPNADEEMSTESESTETSDSEGNDNGGDKSEIKTGLKSDFKNAHKKDDKDEEDSSKKDSHSRRHRRHRRSHRRHRRDNDKTDEEYEAYRQARRSRRRARRAANLKKLNQISQTFAQTAAVAASAFSQAISTSASYIVPAVEEYLPGVISKVTNCDEQRSRQMVGSTIGYSKVALEAMSNIKDSVSQGIGIIGTSVSTQTTEVIGKKYGNDAAEQTKDALGTAANVATTYTTLKNANKII